MNLSLLEIWYTALDSPYGIAVETNDRHLLQQRLYKTRRESNDPRLDGISVVPSPLNPDEMWLLKRDPDAPSQE